MSFRRGLGRLPHAAPASTEPGPAPDDFRRKEAHDAERRTLGSDSRPDGLDAFRHGKRTYCNECVKNASVTSVFAF
ncbi:hypothetical protein [Streptomyces sp. NPDC127105]|uniref:hypothetical protein n=1 Tax=Streptomyces sp. NPDC127105 TaxID=3345359 RepID=UPI00364F1269